MKYLGLLLTVLTLPALSMAQQENTDKQNRLDGAFIVVADSVNLGNILLDNLSDENGKVQVRVTNSGNKPLILKNVTGCCGTNIREWPRTPILPGKIGVIRVEFRIEPRPQRISRTVTIESNAVNGKAFKVAVVGVVIQKRDSNEIAL